MNYSGNLISEISAEFQTWIETAIHHETNKIEQPISELVDSPIEATLLLATLAHMRIWGENVVVTKRGKAESFYFHKKMSDKIAHIIVPQLQIDKYRVDFFITNTRLIDLKLIVECDGHEYHERTKEQAARDKSRDRYFQREGFTVLRFTGSEIFRSPLRCAEEILATMRSLVKNYKGERNE